MPTQIREYAVGEFRGTFPDVPIASGVNMADIKELDADPFFVTLPIIPEIGAISGNGLLYDEALASSVVRQINEKRPGGIFGHIKKDESETAFPEPSGNWLGAKREGNTLWAKCYMPPGAARDRIKRLKAVGGKIATSIYGKGNYEAVREGVRRLTDFSLETIDFAPPERAALGYGAAPIVTSEFANEDNNNMTKEELLAQLTANDVPAAVREQILATGNRQAQVSELQTQLTDKDTMISELQRGIAAFQVREFESALDVRIAELVNWNVTKEADKAKVDAFKRTLRSSILARLGAERAADKVSEMVATVWGELKPLAETVRDALAGPAAVVNGKVRGDQADPRTRVKAMTPAELERAMTEARGGFNF